MRALLLYCICMAQEVCAQPLLPSMGFIPVCGAYSQSHRNVFSFLDNPAALAITEKFSTGMQAGKPWLLENMNTALLVAQIPVSKFAAATALQLATVGPWQEMQGSLALARAQENWELGIQFNFYHLSIQGYETALTIYGNAGISFHLPGKLKAGVHIINPAGGKYGLHEKLPFVFSAGIGYEPSGGFFAEMLVEKKDGQAVDGRLNFNYDPLPLIRIIGGFSTAAGNYFFGVIYSFKSTRLGLITSFHPQLGISPLLQIFFQPVKKSA